MHTANFTEQDKHYMAHAVELAKKGRFTTSPNPNVGCVIAANNIIVGEGFHKKAGLPHAEINALAIAQTKAVNAACYVTLEPCSHYGRTPPCALALVEAGVKRVVIAMVDPNPKVAGRGIAILQEAGIQVDVGLLENEALNLNRGFIKRMQVKQPRVTVKLASSLDGKTALKNGQSQWITGPDARVDVQYYRAMQSALLTGSGTVIADNPSLNVRYEELKQAPMFNGEIDGGSVRQPIRIILDSHNKLNLDEKLFSLEGLVLLVSLKPRDDLGAIACKAQVEQVIGSDDGHGRIDLNLLLSQLNKYEINDLWVEAGAKLAGEFFNNQLVDEFILYQAPKLMGDQARNLVNLPNYSKMEDVVQLTLKDVAIIGNDIRLISNRD
ncbi:bifunctional diaminohydroxyphosphoribosylaminopyrimidine deaminase/5-amino-6-(5-phosphoribosylamino)uracil reductase RibD [Psychromonas aquimarina]|uniref:bifunctional diaminohydroxyphosphoribosylaminopyrimidine deaminase/5-amino-6-(5-phosphoribosylamino)uracil reductase RibD n=1 Tax=Psychromonas aquimarina TaxID=444919 RepID=UPI00041AF8FD|nr:bifunctional diaminohydroxyphosphoribosylaminopyrimidine deaminase/5-amino-6-(5-phosphoribosylamino)uracil reductase RibD [Psychromonas aquimarina]